MEINPMKNYAIQCSNRAFEEVCSGVYLVLKDIELIYKPEQSPYVSAKIVADSFNMYDCVVVRGNKVLHKNF